MKKRYFFIKFLAYLILVSGFICLLSALGGSIFSWFYFKEANIGKKILLELIILISGLIGLLSALGIYQYLLSFIKVDQEIKEIEEEVKEIEEKVQK